MRYSARLLMNSDKPLTIAEIGVRDGYNAIDMMEELNVERIYLVDPFAPYYDSDTYIDQPTQSRYYYNLFKKIAPYFNKVVLVTRTSAFGSGLFNDEFFDYIYIDGDHSYKEVIKDLTYWYPKLKKNGLFAGHDINMEGVKKAVDEFTNNLETSYEIKDIDWFFRKQ